MAQKLIIDQIYDAELTVGDQSFHFIIYHNSTIEIMSGALATWIARRTGPLTQDEFIKYFNSKSKEYTAMNESDFNIYQARQINESAGTRRDRLKRLNGLADLINKEFEIFADEMSKKYNVEFVEDDDAAILIKLRSDHPDFSRDNLSNDIGRISI